LPGPQVVAELPDIDWDRYRLEGGTPIASKESAATNGSREATTRTDRTADGHYLVRGRLFDEKKPKTFNQPWTAEEQRRLEQLLERFPTEEVEMDRWKKIAAALGNRTTLQVQSRCQKYFLKLQKAGLPVPGRLAKAKHRLMRASALNATSTFFPGAPVKMYQADDDDDDTDLPPAAPDSSSITMGNSRRPILNDCYYLEPEDVSDEESVAADLRDTPEYSELMWLKRVRRERELESGRPGGPHVHSGFRCDGCGREPIVGGRFQCTVCLGGDTVDFCCECAPKGLCAAGGSGHTAEHALRPVRLKADVGPDREYAAKKSYLDPNFVP